MERKTKKITRIIRKRRKIKIELRGNVKLDWNGKWKISYNDQINSSW